MGAVFLEFLGDTFADTVGTAGDDDYFILEHSYSPVKIVCVVLENMIAQTILKSY